jgi:hypothetical protein
MKLTFSAGDRQLFADTAGQYIFLLFVGIISALLTVATLVSALACITLFGRGLLSRKGMLQRRIWVKQCRLT